MGLSNDFSQKAQKGAKVCAVGLASAFAIGVAASGALFCADKIADGMMYACKQVDQGINHLVYPNRS